MLTIWTDAEITRRKRYFIVTNPRGAVVHRAAYFEDVLSFCHAEQETEVHIKSPSFAGLLTRLRSRPAEERE